MQYAQKLDEYGFTLHPLPLFEKGPGMVATVPRWLKATGSLAAEARLRRRISQQLPGGVAWVQRNVSNLPTLDAERHVIRARRVVLDVDDAVWLDRRVSQAGRLSVLKRGPGKARWLAQRADVVLAGNAYLAEAMSQWSNSVQVVPSVVDVDRIAPREHGDHEAIVLGWIGSSSTGAYLRQVLPTLELAAQRLAPRPLRLLVVGARVAHAGRLQLDQRVWSEPAELQALTEMDIGLMPLADNAWTRGKCAYKALQYMAAGIPVVASAVGLSAQVVEGSGGGYAVDDDDEWIAAIERLAGDHQMRVRMGSSGRRGVVENYSVKRWSPTVAAALAGS